MGGSLNVNHLMFLGYGALWTIGLSLIGLLGGGIAGFTHRALPHLAESARCDFSAPAMSSSSRARRFSSSCSSPISACRRSA